MSTQACPECQHTHDVTGRARGERVSCACGAAFLVGADPFSTADTAVARPGAALRQGREPAEQRATTPGVAPPQVTGFELMELLGRGGMGEVWKARQLSLGRTVAVKVLPPRLASDAEFVARFDKEATALASLSHPNIVQIIDRGRAGEHYFFAMELVEGRSLREVLEGGVPPLAEALRLMLQVARAVECAHERGIIHRDLKPENVLVDGRGHAKVADFGLAGIRDSETRLQLTATRVAMGTINYMAPEQRRDARSVDGRADLYSLGVVLYEVLTGELPIGRFALPSQRVKGLDAAADEVVARLLENAPEERYPTASALCADLETLLARLSTHPGATPPRLLAEQGRPSGLKGPAAGVPTERMSRRRQLWRGTKAALAGVGALAVAGYLMHTFVGDVEVSVQRPAHAAALEAPGAAPAHAPHPPNTDGDLFVVTHATQGKDGTPILKLDFHPADEASGENVNAHVGHWRLEEGRLHSTQAGNDAGGKRLRPRAYVARRYFTADDFSAETQVTLGPVPAPYHVESGAQRFGELSFRRTGVQVSVFALPGEGMRLLWRYRLQDGTEVSGSSATDVQQLLEDEHPVPEGPFRMSLTLHRLKGGVEAVGRVNGRTFARKLLPGLEGAVAKLALGCRNMDCGFEGLTVHGREVPRPPRVRTAESGE